METSKTNPPAYIILTKMQKVALCEAIKMDRPDKRNIPEVTPSNMEAWLRTEIARTGTPLFNPCSTGMVYTVRVLLEAGVNPNTPSTASGKSCLMAALESANPEPIALDLLRFGANAAFSRSAAVAIACKMGLALVLQEMLKQKPNVNLFMGIGKGGCPLFNAIAHTPHPLEIVRLLVEKGGADVNIKTQHPKGSHVTALWLARRFNQIDVFKYLVEKGAVLKPDFILETTRPDRCCEWTEFVEFLTRREDTRCKAHHNYWTFHFAAKAPADSFPLKQVKPGKRARQESDQGEREKKRLVKDEEVQLVK